MKATINAIAATALPALSLNELNAARARAGLQPINLSDTARVTQANTSQSTPMRYVTEASTLQLEAGEWPRQLTTSLGNELPFIRQTVNDEMAVYQQANGCLKLVIFND